MTRKPVHGTARLVLLVNGISYSLRPLDPHPVVARKAWRLTKGDGTTYDVALMEHGPECTCGDWVYRQRNSGMPCKHCAALKTLGLL
jgi:hypothetical protein